VLTAAGTTDQVLHSAWFQGVDDQPAPSAADADQLLGRQPSPRTQVREVAFRGARPDARASSGTRHRPPGFVVGDEHVQSAPSCVLREFAAKAEVAHASRLAAATYSTRPSIGIS